MAIGVADMKNVIRFPNTWDLEYLRKFNNREGTRVQFDELARDVVAAFTTFNQGLVSPETNWLAAYIRTTTDPTVKYDVGTSGDELPPVAEHGRTDPVTGSATGHMLPMRDYGGALGWTYWALRRANREDLERNIRTLVTRAETTWEKRILTRMFSIAADTVGGTGKSVPFADGGIADANFVPMPHAGKTFNSSHTHFFRNSNDDSGRNKFLADAAATLWEHGITGPYDLLVSDADLTSWTGMNNATTKSDANFIKPERGIITMQNIDQRAAIDEQQYVGVIEIPRTYFFVRPVNRIPTGYAGVFRPRGYNSPDNPIAVRYEEGYPLGLTMVAEVNHFPFEESQATFTFGAGVNNRLAGACGRFASSGNYTDPTIG